MKRNYRTAIGNLQAGALLVTAVSAALITGCGGGGTGRVASKTPTKATKVHVQAVQILSLRNMAQSGVPNGTFTAMRGEIAPVAVGAIGAVSNGTGAVSMTTAAPPPVPLLGQFLSYIAATSITNRTKGPSCHADLPCGRPSWADT